MRINDEPMLYSRTCISMRCVYCICNIHRCVDGNELVIVEPNRISNIKKEMNQWSFFYCTILLCVCMCFFPLIHLMFKFHLSSSSMRRQCSFSPVPSSLLLYSFSAFQTKLSNNITHKNGILRKYRKRCVRVCAFMYVCEYERLPRVSLLHHFILLLLLLLGSFRSSSSYSFSILSSSFLLSEVSWITNVERIVKLVLFFFSILFLLLRFYFLSFIYTFGLPTPSRLSVCVCLLFVVSSLFSYLLSFSLPLSWSTSFSLHFFHFFNLFSLACEYCIVYFVVVVFFG